MKKKVALVLLSLLCLSGIATASTPIRFCFLPEVAIPVKPNVYGLNLGIITGNSYNSQKVAGLDLALVASLTSIKGAQVSLVNISDESVGAQLAGLNVADNFGGVQLGLFNGVGVTSDSVQVGLVNCSKKSKSVQVGLINGSSNSKGVQVGLINIMDNGFIPVCPILNFSVK